MKSISWLWEIPLALLSFIFYKVTKFVVGNLFVVYLAIAKDKASQWRILSQETIDTPLSLPVLMTKGPRWNTHAVIGTLGPFQVQNEIAMNIDSANNSSRSWIAVVYSFPDYKTITSIDSSEISQDNSWHLIKLKSEKYSLGVRYYNYLDKICYPAVKIDGKQLTETYTVSSKVNDYYHNLIQYKNWFYISLHYYIYVILKYRKWLPEAFVRKEYLPVGAPDTYFHYNYLAKQQALKLDFTPIIINNFDLYFTLYDRSSLPLTWCKITEEQYLLPPQAVDGFYLLRIRPKPENSQTIAVSECFDSQSIEENDSIQHWQISS
ncbi:DUF6208 family protein [Myxosarcina sp. GI1(2024)]